MRLVSFNVENLFARPVAMDTHAADAATRAAVLAAQAHVTELLEQPSYAGHESEILADLDTLGLLTSDDGPFAVLRTIRGQLLTRPRTGPVVLAATGRADWVGWVALTLGEVNEVATENTARVIHDLGADVMTAVEVENRPTLDLFSRSLLPAVGGTPYEQVMVIDGNDTRGIDVGLMARATYRLDFIRTHVFDQDATGVVFSRDCCEYHLVTPAGTPFVVLANHFKSKGYAAADDPIGAKRRLRQATRVAQVYRGLLAAGIDHVAVMGDLNDDPASTALAPLLSVDGLQDISAVTGFDWDHRFGTYGSGNASEKIDYVLLSPALFALATGGGVFRKGVWHGDRTTDPWDIYPTMTSDVEAASDHAAIYADLTDF
jgi:endonuclease/exonuclease/phosphatase family metal-dependent hydrolase